MFFEALDLDKTDLIPCGEMSGRIEVSPEYRLAPFPRYLNAIPTLAAQY